MKKLLTPLAVLALTSSTFAESQLLNESFDTWPAAGWTIVDNGGFGTGWIHHAGTQRAWHEDESGGITDFHLVSPVMDFGATTGTALSFDNETNFGRWLANHPRTLGGGIYTVEVTTDGGITWTEVWMDNALGDFILHSPAVDLSAWDGMNHVQIGFHFIGSFDQEVMIDNVVVDGSGVDMVYSIDQYDDGGAGVIAFNIDAASHNAMVTIGYSTAGSGPTFRAAIGQWVDMSHPISFFAPMQTNAAGSAALGMVKPAGSMGLTLYTQAYDLATGTLTNSLAEIIL